MNFGNSKRRLAADKLSERIETRCDLEPSESNETPSERRRRISYKGKTHRRIFNKPKQTLSTRIHSRHVAKPRAVLTDSTCVQKRCLRSNTRLGEPKTPEQYLSPGHSYSEKTLTPDKSMLDLLNGINDANTKQDDSNLMHKIKTEPIDDVCTDDDLTPPDSGQYWNSVNQASSPSVCDVKLENCIDDSLLCCDVFPPESGRLKDFEDKLTKPIQSEVPIVASQAVQENMFKPTSTAAGLQFGTSVDETSQQLPGSVKLKVMHPLRSILKPISSPKCAPVLKLIPFHLSLAFHCYKTTEVVTVMNYQNLIKPLIVQLLDELGNPSFQPGIEVQLSSMDGLQFEPLLESAELNECGQVNYGTPMVFTNTRKLATKCPVEMCSNFCYGMFTVTSRAWYKNKETLGPSLRFHLLPNFASRIIRQNYPLNQDYASRLLVETYNEKYCVAGAALREFRLYVVTDDDQMVGSAANAQFKVKIWRINERVDNQLDEDLAALSLADGDYHCDGAFIVKRTAPTKTGLHCFQFMYSNGKCVVFSDVIKLTVLPEKPTKLIVPKHVGIPVVSNSSIRQSRMIVENLKVHVTDAYENVTSVSGVLSIKLLSQRDNCETPTFIGGIRSIEVPIVNGEVILARILTAVNCPGIDGKQYFLRFKATSVDIPQTNTMVHDLPFFFYRDTTKQDLLIKLTKENESLLSSLKVYKELLEISDKLSDALQGNLLQLESEEQTSLSALRDIGICDESVDTSLKVQVLLQEKLMLLSDVFRTLDNDILSKHSIKSEILGEVRQLACVADRDVAEILSWHLADSMDCVVADTAEKAFEFLRNTEDKRDVLALDLVKKDDALDIWKSNLPHVQIPHKFEPTGNPIAVREYLIFPRDVDRCTVVFGSLLGNTILMDNLEDAIEYRRKIVQHTICPTILTKDGHRIQSNGSVLSRKKFSTSENLVFRAPFVYTEQELDHAIELLESHRLIVEQREKAQLQMEDYNKISIDNGMPGKRVECLKMESRSKELKPQIDNLQTIVMGSNYVVLKNGMEIDTIMHDSTIPDKTNKLKVV